MSNRVIIVHGEKQLSDGSIHPEYIDRMRMAQGYHPPAIILLTGGKTRAEFPSEAEQAKKWFMDNSTVYHSEDILIEDRSRTSAENIIFGQERLVAKNIVPDQVMVFARASAMPKTKHLYKRLWTLGAPTFSFIKTRDTKSLAYKIADLTALYLAAVIDPRDRWILAIPKKIFRNS